MTKATFIHALILVACGGSQTSKATAPSSLAVGESCDPARDAYACTSDGLQMLVCDARHWKLAAKCAGAARCVSTPTKIKCDDTISEAGAPCASEGDVACASDGSALLACTNKTMIETSRCRGDKGCAVVAGTPTCDRTIAEPGDRCDAESEVACTPNHEAIVECRNKTMVQTTVCHCRMSVAGTSVRCL